MRQTFQTIDFTCGKRENGRPVIDFGLDIFENSLGNMRKKRELGRLWNMFEKKPVMLAIVLLIFMMSTGHIRAGGLITSGPAASERELGQLLERLTDIATKTSMNADFVPGMVTVFYGDDLEARGVRTVGEVFNLVPGMNLSLTSGVFWKTVVRGVPKPFSGGHVKILLDGVPMTTGFGIDLVPNMPLEQVERIEVIRGPGSSVHGEFAYSGVMNIITRRDGNRVSATAGRYDTHGGGGVFSADSPAGFKLSLNAAILDTQGTEASVGPTWLSVDSKPAGEDDSAGEQPAPTPAPDVPKDDLAPEYDNGRQPEEDTDRIGDKKQYRSALLGIDYKRFSLDAHFLENDLRDFFKSRQWGAAARQGLDISRDLKANLMLGWKTQQFDSDRHTCIPENPEDPGLGWVYGFDYIENHFHGGLEVVGKMWENHTLLAGIAAARTQIADVTRRYAGKLLHYEDKDRNVVGVTLQDEFAVSDRFTLTTGLRYDHYDDAGDHFSPKMAAVYRLNKNRAAPVRHILKAQYGRAFRPPTFLEMYALFEGPETEHETIDTGEIGYIFRTSRTVGRATLFYSWFEARIDDSLYRNEPGKFETAGFELEIERTLFSDILRAMADISYTKTENRDTGGEIGESSEWLGNAGLVFRPFRMLELSLQYRYVGERNTVYRYGEADAGAYNTVDFTAGLYNLGITGLTVRAGVKNLFETDIRYTSDSLDDYLQTCGYGHSNDDPGRFWWTKICWEF